ncbi:type II toxin-antitoxin system RelE/ParE family toxin [Moraxella nonliquefaciens]|uniref:type II toxin-antitoxin system RelE/ParE family toxin n=1 Tax=Moraxella nonliquefaciens TaxID=478 RepID=UPI003D0DC12E
MLHFAETSLFTKQIIDLMDDEEYRLLQTNLMKNPHQGDIVRGTGGVRKTRWSIDGKGKSGGSRIIYFFVDDAGIFFMLLAYPKSKQTTLSADEKKEMLKLTTAIKEIYRAK